MHKKLLTLIITLKSAIFLFGQTGTIVDPFTSLHQAAAITAAGVYYFDIGGSTFDTYVDANGYVQIAIDFGDGTGNLPQGTSLTNSSRGILNTTALAALTETREVRISSSTGNIDVTTTNSTIISRIQSNTTLHRGSGDNTINDDWIGTNANRFTVNASCVTSEGTSLHQNIMHVCESTASFNWFPSGNTQRELWSSGEVTDGTSFHLWVKGNINCTTRITSLDQAAAITTAGVYCFDIGGNIFDTYVDANGYVQIAIDFGDGTGNLPQGTSLTNSSRGILNTAALAALTETREVRISSSTGNIDVTTTNSTIISRIQSNTTLHRGSGDNSINDDWTGTNANRFTVNAGCVTTQGTSLHQNIMHVCESTASFNWFPSGNTQRELWSSGEVTDGTSFHLWVKGNINCTTRITSLDQAAAITTAGVYCFDIGGIIFDTYVDANGYVQIAIDFGDGTGNLPQGTSLTNSGRGILNTTVLAALTETREVRISSSTGNIDVTTTNSTIISRIQSNTTLHRGSGDNSINDDWTGTNANRFTVNAGCVTTQGTSLHQNIMHVCESTASFNWFPSGNTQRELWSSGEVTDGTSFHLWVKGNITALPIELTYFNAKIIDHKYVRLDWQTASETSNHYFTVERSINDIDWETVARVEGAGNSSFPLSYEAIDDVPYPGISYYHLKQTDFDGRFKCFRKISVSLQKLNSEVIIYPNPVSTELTIKGDALELKNIFIYNLMGQNVTALTKRIISKEFKLVLDLSKLNSGIYYIKTKTTTNKVYKQ